jgi:galactarate dehydratase
VLTDMPLSLHPAQALEPLEGYCFEGYRNPDGSVGTRNILGISTSVQCVAGVARVVLERIKQELLPKYPHVDDAVVLNHGYGCGVAIDAPAAVIPIRTLQNLARNPNLGGEVMVPGLGCEKLEPRRLVTGLPEDVILELQDETLKGFSGMVGGILELAERNLERLDRR